MQNTVHQFLSLILGCLIVISLPVQAESINLKLQHKSLILIAKQANLSEILKKITSITGVKIHHALLAEQQLNVQCDSYNVSQLINCVFAGQANTVLRYAKQDNQILELWILNAELSQTVISELNQTRLENKQADFALNETAQAARRADAIARLARQRNYDATNQQTITVALSDSDASVRVQAVAALAKVGGENTTQALQNALSDTDVSVRLMAIDSAGNNIALLQQARFDNDATVRSYAQLKLSELESTRLLK